MLSGVLAKHCSGLMIGLYVPIIEPVWRLPIRVELLTKKNLSKLKRTLSTFAIFLLVHIAKKISIIGDHFIPLKEFNTVGERMLEGKAKIKETDMSMKMQMHAMASASQALGVYDVYDYTSIAAHIKKEFDKLYGSGWQCVVGSKFGCFITHSKGSFIYFALESLNFLIFKGSN